MMNLVYADSKGNVFDHGDFIALGRNGDVVTEILEDELIPLPDGATLVSLPDTKPIVLDPSSDQMIAAPDDWITVGALLPQGYTRLLLPAYVKTDSSKRLPLFGYTAVAWKEGQFFVAARQTDEPDRWNPEHCDRQELALSVERLLLKYPNNRVMTHLSKCALEYECLTAANTFLHRWEGAVPVSYSCNAGCYGCISEQPDDSGFVAPQTRMNFKPEVQELVEIMLEHLREPDSIISFGQGCEGEPSTQAKLIIDAIREVRARTSLGFININTNGGLTDHLRAIVDAGLDLMRVSTISAIEEHYQAYYKPRGYSLANVEKTLTYAARKGVFTSINYLIFPGVTDREEELEAMIEFARRTGLRRIQLRNLNIDPEGYFAFLPSPKGETFGMYQAIDILRSELPDVQVGSFTIVPE